MAYLYKNINSNTTTTVAGSGQGILHTVVVNKEDGDITVFDKTGTLALLKDNISEGTYRFDINWIGFLKITTAGSPDLTISYGINQSA